MAIGETLYLGGEDGTLLRLDPGAAQPETIPTETTAQLRTSVAIGETLYLAGTGGTLLRLDPGAAQPETIPTETTEWLLTSVAIGETLYLAETGGTLLRLDPGAAQPDTIPTETTAWLETSVAIGETLYLAGRAARSCASIPARRNPRPSRRRRPQRSAPPWPLVRRSISPESAARSCALIPARRNPRPSRRRRPHRLLTSVAIGETLYLAGTGGTLIATPPPSAAGLAGFPQPVELDEGEDGFTVDDPLQAFVDDLVTRLAPVPDRVTDLRLALAGINAERAALENFAADRRARLEQGLFALLANEDPVVDFASFMAACRTMTPVEAVAEDGTTVLQDNTAACLSAFAAQEAQEETPWWETLARQVPPGLLLLFLLVTLGGLYRYNMRMAGFHHSRADLLELISIGRDPGACLSKQDWVDIRETADALAADKVEFGATKANVGPQGIGWELLSRRA